MHYLPLRFVSVHGGGVAILQLWRSIERKNAIVAWSKLPHRILDVRAGSFSARTNVSRDRKAIDRSLPAAVK